MGAGAVMQALQLRGIGMTSPRARERLANVLIEKGISSEPVLAAIRATPRHLFVEEGLESHAYENKSLPIGLGQTISQPYIVARMTEILLANGPLEKVLEIGTGCGYQTAILAQVVEMVYSVERLSALQDRARRLLRRLGVKNTRYEHSDGSWGWERHAPYDGIIVTAAPKTVPPELLAQLAPGGRLVIPVGPNGQQRLQLIEHTENGFEHTDVEAVSFVPLLNGTSTERL